jgi:hypothetical protein
MAGLPDVEIHVGYSRAPQIERFKENEWHVPSLNFSDWVKQNWEAAGGAQWAGRVSRYYSDCSVIKLDDEPRDDQIIVFQLGGLDLAWWSGKYLWARRVRGEYIVQVNVVLSMVTCTNMAGTCVLEFEEHGKLLGLELKHMVKRTLATAAVVSRQQAVRLIWVTPPLLGFGVIHDNAVVVDRRRPHVKDALSDHVLLPQWLPKRRRHE